MKHGAGALQPTKARPLKSLKKMAPVTPQPTLKQAQSCFMCFVEKSSRGFPRNPSRTFVRNSEIHQHIGAT